jgi:hypothetical protein
MRLAALQATAVLAAVLAAVALVRLAAPAQAAGAATLHVYQAALCGLSLGLVVGLLRWRWERAEVADLVVESARPAPGRCGISWPVRSAIRACRSATGFRNRPGSSTPRAVRSGFPVRVLSAR